MAPRTRKGHPRHRVTEAAFDAVMFDLFDRLKVKDEAVRKWIVKVLQSKTRDGQRIHGEKLSELQRQQTNLKNQRDRLLNLRILDEIDEKTFAAKDTELRDREARVMLELEGHGRQTSENADLAIKVFELSQALRTKWDSAETPDKRRILEILCLNFSLADATLCPTMRKPFDALAEGLSVQSGRSSWTTEELSRRIELFVEGVATLDPHIKQMLLCLETPRCPVEPFPALQSRPRLCIERPMTARTCVRASGGSWSRCQARWRLTCWGAMPGFAASNTARLRKGLRGTPR